MDTYDKLKALTAEQIELDSVKVPNNIQQLVRDNFDDWVVKWFPLLKRQKKSCYGELLGLLARAEIFDVTREQLRTCVWRVRNEREAVKALAGAGVKAAALPGELVQVQPPPQISERAVAVTTPVVVSKPVGTSPQSVAAGADDGVFGRGCSVAPDNTWPDLPLYLEGLKKEKVEGWGAWSGYDEDFWQDILDKREKHDRVESVKFDINGGYIGMLGLFSNENRKEIFRLLLKKAPAKRNR